MTGWIKGGLHGSVRCLREGAVQPRTAGVCCPVAIGASAPRRAATSPLARCCEVPQQPLL